MELSQEDLFILYTAMARLLSTCGNDSEWRAAFLVKGNALQRRIIEQSDGSVTFESMLQVETLREKEENHG